MSTAAAKAVAQHAYKPGEALPTTGCAQLRKQRKRCRQAEAMAAAAATSGAASSSQLGAAAGAEGPAASAVDLRR